MGDPRPPGKLEVIEFIGKANPDTVGNSPTLSIKGFGPNGVLSSGYGWYRIKGLFTLSQGAQICTSIAGHMTTYQWPVGHCFLEQIELPVKYVKGYKSQEETIAYIRGTVERILNL